MESKPPVRYFEGIEKFDESERGIFEKITQSFERQTKRTNRLYGHGTRATHAKSHAILKGELVVADGLPEELRQGLFAKARTYPVLARIASVLGELQRDNVTMQRGFALKVIGVDAGPMLPGHEGEVTQDFLFNNGLRFIAGDAEEFLRRQTMFEMSIERGNGLKPAMTKAARAANAVLERVGRGSANLDFIGHPPKHIFADTYGTQAAIRYGDYVAKLAIGPTPETEARLPKRHRVGEGFAPIRDQIADLFRTQGVELDLCAQLCTDIERMPVEDASVEWPQELSPYRIVGRLCFPPQPAYAPERKRFVEDVMSFSPAHALVAHRPLGSIMRARMHVYPLMSRLRHEMNGIAQREPRGIDEIPDGTFASQDVVLEHGALPEAAQHAAE